MEITENNHVSLLLSSRKLLSLTGVEDVISFDDTTVYLITNDGKLLIEGKDLHITTLDVSLGNMAIEGYISAMIYNDKETGKKEGFFSKMLK